MDPDFIFDLIRYGFFSTPAEPRYYKCSVHTGPLRALCTPSNAQEGAVIVPASVSSGKEVEWLAEAFKMPTEIS